ncbi:MAG: hypothetical protein AAF409_00880 [Pseudomonadota bacterium]
MRTPNLDTIRGNRTLLQMFLKFLQRRNLVRLYQFYYEHENEVTAYRLSYDKVTAPEKAFLGKVYTAVIWAYTNELVKATNALENDNYRGGSATAAKQEVHRRAFASTGWKATFEKSMDHIGKLLEKLATDEFLKSKPYQTYVRATIKKKGKSMRKNFKLDVEIDDFLGLAFAVQTGDGPTVRRLSQEIAEAETVKTKKKTKATDIVSDSPQRAEGYVPRGLRCELQRGGGIEAAHAPPGNAGAFGVLQPGSSTDYAVETFLKSVGSDLKWVSLAHDVQHTQFT